MGKEYYIFMVFLSVISHLLADASYENISVFCRDRADPDHSQPLKRRSGLSGESRKVFEEFSFFRKRNRREKHFQRQTRKEWGHFLRNIKRSGSADPGNRAGGRRYL